MGALGEVEETLNRRIESSGKVVEQQKSTTADIFSKNPIA